jgi:aspartyl protease family protein
MGLEDRDWWKEVLKDRASKEGGIATSRPVSPSPSSGLSIGLKWGPAGIVAFWLTVMGLLYLAMNHYLKPKPVIVSASGDLVIPRAKDGHFYATGSVNGQPVNFLVDTGASLVTVSEQFARSAGIADGDPTVFKTANGNLSGRIVSGVPISVGPIDVSAVKIGVGLVGHEVGDALLGQSFLSKFEIVLKGEQMILRKR